MSNFSFEISHLTGKTTRILSAIQGLFPSSDWFDLTFRRNISKNYIIDMPRIFLWNNYFLSNFCFVICHLRVKPLRTMEESSHFCWLASFSFDSNHNAGINISPGGQNARHTRYTWQRRNVWRDQTALTDALSPPSLSQDCLVTRGGHRYPCVVLLCSVLICW